MKLTGKLCTVGDLVLEGATNMPGTPGIEIKREDGRVITIIGMTREEVIFAADLGMFERVTLTLARF